MQYGLTLPNLDAGGDARTLAELAHEAEETGWNGVFIFDTINVIQYGANATCDPWIALAAIATRTEHVRIGTMITPLSRRRPWKLARETVTLDHLSSGRLILPVGLGDVGDGGFSKVGEETNRRIRAKRLDEGLEILVGLWSGQPFSYSGEQYQVQEMTFLPPPVQSPRIPIWVVGAWPRMKSMQRALRWDGIIPARMNDDGTFAEMTPADVQAMQTLIDEQRPQGTPFDIVIEGNTPGEDREKAAATVRPFAEAGVTWWLESVWSREGLDGMRTRIKQGPPRL